MKVIFKNSSLVFLSKGERPKVTTYSIKSEGYLSIEGKIIKYPGYFFTNPITLYPNSTIELDNQSAVDVIPLSVFDEGISQYRGLIRTESGTASLSKVNTTYTYTNNTKEDMEVYVCYSGDESTIKIDGELLTKVVE